MLRKLAALVAVIMFAFPAIGAAPAEKPAETLEKVPVVQDGIRPKCGTPPTVPNALERSCIHSVETDRTMCVHDVGGITDQMGIQWRLMLILAQPMCGGPWVPIRLQGIPVPGQVMPSEEAI